MRRLVLLLVMVTVVVVVSAGMALGAAGQSVKVEGIGTLTIPEGVEVIAKNTHGSSAFKLLTEAAGVWYASEMALATISNAGGTVSPEACEVARESSLNAMKRKYPDLRVLRSQPVSYLKLGDKSVASTAFSVYVQAYALTTEFYLFAQDGKIVVFLFAATDGDTKYWRPVYQQIVAEFKL